MADQILPSGPRRRWLAPEVLQTSAMDCGPAALKCLLEGFGVSVSYGRLREACQTSVDGSSIDTIEEVARLLGLEAEQLMMPAENLLSPPADALPAIVVIRLPSSTHFIVLWRRLGSYLQVMDPARGRRWVRASDLAPQLYLHAQPVPAEAFGAFAVDPAFTGPLAWRVGHAMGRSRGRRFLRGWHAAEAGAHEGGGPTDDWGAHPWQSVVRLDGAVRAAERLMAAGAVRRGAEAEKVIGALLWSSPGALEGQPGGALDTAAGAELAPFLCASPMARLPKGQDEGHDDIDGGDQVLLRGAVLVRIAGLTSTAGEGGDAAAFSSPGGAASRTPVGPATPLPRELAAALGEKRPSLLRSLVALWSPRARWLGAALAFAVLAVAVGTMAELMSVRPLLSPPTGTTAPPPESGRGALPPGFVVLGAVVLGLFVLEWPLMLGTRYLGRALDQGLRRAFLQKLPRLGDRYFSSRPVSDMAERAHLLHRVRLLPGLAAQLGRTLLELVLMTMAIVWLYPRGAPIALALLVAACSLPLAGVSVLAERDLRLRVHSGSLMRFYLDALLGLSAVRTHGAERAVTRAHADRLGEWRRAGGAVVATALWIESGVVLLTTLGAGFLVMGSLDSAAPGSVAAATTLLLLFFALGLPTHAAKLMALWRQLPDHRNVTLRLLEPLGAPDEQETAPAPDGGGRTVGTPDLEPRGEGAPPPSAHDAAVAIDLEAVSVEAGGHLVLTEVSCHIEPRTHVAVVGTSGAGKSTLLGLLLGFYRPSAGRVLVDGRDLSAAGGALGAVRSRTAWVDPGVQLWNRSLQENIGYGSSTLPSSAALARVVVDAELTEVVSRLPQGMATLLGEGGGLLSGGEAQRVRLARELIRVPRARLVLLDEPYRGLDRGTRRRLLERARRHWANATLIVVSHDIEQTRDFPRVLVIEGGRIVEDGEPGRLAATPGSRYADLLATEARVREQRWSASFWRRLIVRDGNVHPNPK